MGTGLIVLVVTACGMGIMAVLLYAAILKVVNMLWKEGDKNGSRETRADRRHHRNESD